MDRRKGRLPSLRLVRGWIHHFQTIHYSFGSALEEMPKQPSRKVERYHALTRGYSVRLRVYQLMQFQEGGSHFSVRK
jgi:hypothetical protein